MSKEDGKLVGLLGLVDAAAWERLRIFMQSPWFNRSAAVRSLLELHYAAANGSASLQADEALFAEIFPQTDFDPVKWKNLRAALQRKLDQFFAQEALSRDEDLQRRLQLRHLNALSERKYFPKYHQKALEGILAAEIEEEQRQLNLFHIAEEWETAQFRLDDRSQSTDADGPYRHAWQFFQLQTLRFLVRKANRGAMVGEVADTAQAEMILPMIDASPQALPAVQLYRTLLDVFRQPTAQQAFDRLQAQLKDLGPALAPPDASDIFTGAINHCIRRINAGESGFATTLLALYKDMDALGLLLLHGRLPASQFKNMVGLALRFHEFDWTQAIIDRYASRLDQDPFGNAEAFSRGMLHFAKSDFQEAERCFNLVLRQFEDVFYGLDARSYLLRIYYETDNWLGLESLAESFKMYLRRNKRIPKAHRQSYLQTVRFFSKLSKIQDWKAAEFTKLKQEIERTAFAAISKQWLLDKIDLRIAALQR